MLNALEGSCERVVGQEDGGGHDWRELVVVGVRELVGKASGSIRGDTVSSFKGLELNYKTV